MKPLLLLLRLLSSSVVRLPQDGDPFILTFEPDAVMASKRVVQRRIFFFLRLCDYVIFNTLHSMVVESVTELLDQLNMATQAAEMQKTSSERSLEAVDEKKDIKNIDDARKSVFITEVMLVLGELTFVPAASDFENEFHKFSQLEQK